jgi:hypothetical protein
MANGQITIHESHLPRHFFVGVPVGLAGSSYEKAMEMFGPNSTVTADAGFRRCVAASEAHLEDLRMEHAPLRSLTRAEMRRGD